MKTFKAMYNWACSMLENIRHYCSCYIKCYFIRLCVIWDRRKIRGRLFKIVEVTKVDEKLFEIGKAGKVEGLVDNKSLSDDSVVTVDVLVSVDRVTVEIDAVDNELKRATKVKALYKTFLVL